MKIFYIQNKITNIKEEEGINGFTLYEQLIKK